MKSKFMIQPEVKVGTILVRGIGSGCDTFFQVTKRSDKTCCAAEIECKITKRYHKFQSADIIPVPNKFVDPSQNPNNDSTWLKSVVKLKLTERTIGPTDRYCGWRIFEGKSLNQYSP
jgi:hypothetical protein